VNQTPNSQPEQTLTARLGLIMPWLTGARWPAAGAPVVRDVWREHRGFALMIGAYILLGYFVQWVLQIHDMMDLRLWSQTLLIVGAGYTAVFLCGFAVWVMLTYRGDDGLFTATWRSLRARYLTPRRFGGFAVVLLLTPLFMSAFGSFKSTIPAIQAFCWDPTFMAWDRALHGGHHPWEWLQPVLGRPLATSVLNFFYNLWFFVLFTVIFWQAWSGNRRLRVQFLLSFVLVWCVIGTATAIALSSAGPCYYGQVTGLNDPYAPLMTYLREAGRHYPVWALHMQDTLWQGYQEGGTNLIKGITAMPSMHVAIAVLFALLAGRTNRWFGLAMSGFAVVIFLGSIHLAWHYAIDGYLAAGMTVVIWWAVGRGLRWKGATREAADG